MPETLIFNDWLNGRWCIVTLRPDSLLPRTRGDVAVELPDGSIRVLPAFTLSRKRERGFKQWDAT